MIEFKKCPVIDGVAFATMEDAKRHGIKALLNIDANAVVDAILSNADKLVDILTTKSTSLTKARRINGGTKKRAVKPVTTQPSEPQSTQPAN